MRMQRVTIGGKKGVTHPKFGKLENISGEVRQGETLQECVQLAGGEKNAQDALNWLAQFGAKREVTARITNAPDDDTPDGLKSAISKIFESAAPSAGRIGPTASVIRDFGSKAAEVLAGATDNPEEAMERLRALARDLGVS